MSINEIERILLRDWDPIDIADVAAVNDEYHRYAVMIESTLSGNVSIERIYEMLLKFERDDMGFLGDPARAYRVAEKLVNLLSNPSR